MVSLGHQPWLTGDGLVGVSKLELESPSLLDTERTLPWSKGPKQARFLGVLKMGVPQNGWFTLEHAIKMDDLGVPPFQETSTYSIIFPKNYNMD